MLDIILQSTKMQSFIQDFLRQKATGDAHGSHFVYWVPIEVFKQLPICRWKFNRPPDEARVAEIRSHIETSKRIDGIVYLACIDNQLVCYESNHRREALKTITDVAPVLVDIIWDANDDIVKQEFLRLNKCVSVPELYITDTPASVDTSALRELVDGFCKNYPSMKVSSNRPNRPNFNRDMLLDEFYRVLTEQQITVPELESRLQRLNMTLSNKDRAGLSDKVIAKCEASGLWLFAWSSKLKDI